MYLIFTLGFISFLLSLALTPIVRDIFLRRGIVDLPDQFRKLHIHPVPRVGGIAIAISYGASFLLVLLLPFSYSHVVEDALPGIWKMCVAAGLIFLTGLLDDLIGLKPWQKLAEQLAAACMAYMAGVQISLFPGEAWDPLISIPVSLLWIIGCTNAFNLIDGMDGLAAGVGFFATITVLIAALSYGNLQLALLTVPLAGALLAFLRYNFNPASIFLGDSGSMLIGFLLGCYGVLWSQKSATVLGMTAPLMAMAIPLLDIGVALVRRFIRHQPLFDGDRRHIHHRLLDRGLTPKKAAFLIYGASGVAALFSLVQNALTNEFQGLIIVLFCVAAWIGIQHLGYVEFGIARQMFMKGAFRRIIDSQTQLQQFEDSLRSTATIQDAWDAIVSASRGFGFSSIRANLLGRVYEMPIESKELTLHWQVRVPLPGNQYINFERSVDAELSPVLLSGFVRAVEHNLRLKLEPTSTNTELAAAPGTLPASSSQ